MNTRKPSDILKESAHRHFPLPKSHWTLYSEWKDMLMLHWKVDASIAKQLLPPSLSIDTFEGGAWITMTVLTVDNFKTRLLSMIGGKIKFDQILLHTYVLRNGKPGIYIFKQEVEKSTSSQMYQRVLKRPNGNTVFNRTNSDTHAITASNPTNEFELHINYKILEESINNAHSGWFTNRFKYYYQSEEQLLALIVHHLELQVHEVRLNNFSCNIQVGDLIIDRPPEAAFFSYGIQKLTWPKFAIK